MNWKETTLLHSWRGIIAEYQQTPALEQERCNVHYTRVYVALGEGGAHSIWGVATLSHGYPTTASGNHGYPHSRDVINEIRERHFMLGVLPKPFMDAIMVNEKMGLLMQQMITDPVKGAAFISHRSDRTRPED
jgi:hypothetical protein